MIPAEIKKFFDKKGVSYKVLEHKAVDSPSKAAIELGVDPSRVAVANILRDKLGVLMVIYPSNGILDLGALNEKLGRSFKLLSSDDIGMELPTYHNAQCAPLAMIYQLGAEVYSGYASSADVYFSINNTSLCKLGGADFCMLQGPAMYDEFFVKMQVIEADNSQKKFRQSRKDIIRERIKKIDSLPAMPTMAQRLLQLSANPYAGVRDLALIIEQDPSLSAQLVRYARSPLYGYTGDLHSVQDVVSRVLGFDMVLDMAIGVSVGRMFKNPKGGKLGLDNFWRHATFSAVLCQKLSAAVMGPSKARPGTAYLCGLMHNFGFLLLGHLFPQEFMMLNKAITRFPDNSVIELEKTVIGVTHMELGIWLMQAWDMPDEIVMSIREHHNEHYRDAHFVYPGLVMVANRLLSDMEFGDEMSDQIPQGLIEALGLDMDKVHEIFENIMSDGQGLEYMALQMAA